MTGNFLQNWIVLVIDDEPENIEIARLLLARHGATVLTATSAKEGLALAAAQIPTLILTDISMPGMSGWDLISELRKDARTHAIPVVALTAHMSQEYRDQALAMGFRRFITKPLMPKTMVQDLLAAVKDLPELNKEDDNAHTG